MSDGLRIDLLARVSEAAGELWDANGIGVVFVDSAVAKSLPPDVPILVRFEPDVAGRLGVYTMIFTDVST